MHPIQDLFLKIFSYVLQIDMHFICTPMWTKFYSCEKRVLHQYKKHKGKNAAPIMQGMIGAAWRLPRRNPEIGGGDAPSVGL
jgi:hypothetical protein